MPHGTIVEIIPASRADVFRLLHDYKRRLEWDTMLQAADLGDDHSSAGLHATSICKVKTHLGAMTLKALYVSFREPDVAAFKMINRPPFFDRLSASFRHRDRSDGSSEIRYVYQFTARPRWLRPLLHPLMHAVLRFETRRRLRSLRHFFESRWKAQS